MKSLDVAFIFAAGRGERLRPLTDQTPKPLLPYRGRPILDHIVDSLKNLGVKKIVFNAWHLKEQIVAYARKLQKDTGLEVLVSQEDELLGTGGGLKKAWGLIGAQEFLVLNGDLLFEGDLRGFIERAQSHRDTLATWWLTDVQQGQTRIGVKGGLISQIGDLWKADPPDTLGCFTGIQWIRDIDYKDLPDKGCIIRQYFLGRLKEGKKLAADFDGLRSWVDIGTFERYRELQALPPL